MRCAARVLASAKVWGGRRAAYARSRAGSGSIWSPLVWPVEPPRDRKNTIHLGSPSTGFPGRRGSQPEQQRLPFTRGTHPALSSPIPPSSFGSPFPQANRDSYTELGSRLAWRVSFQTPSTHIPLSKGFSKQQTSPGLGESRGASGTVN